MRDIGQWYLEHFKSSPIPIRKRNTIGLEEILTAGSVRDQRQLHLLSAVSQDPPVAEGRCLMMRYRLKSYSIDFLVEVAWAAPSVRLIHTGDQHPG